MSPVDEGENNEAVTSFSVQADDGIAAELGVFVLISPAASCAGPSLAYQRNGKHYATRPIIFRKS